MKEPDLITRLRIHQKTSQILSNLLICLMMVSFTVGFLQFGRRLLPEWNGNYLVLIAVFLSFEAIFTRGSARELDFKERIFFRASEWIAFAVIIKILIYLYNGFESFFNDLKLWQADIFSFFTLEYMVALGIAALIWFSSRGYSGEMDELFDRERDAAWDDLGKLQNALNEIRARMMARVFIQGILLIVFAIFARIESTQLLRTLGINTPGYQTPVINVLVYFMLAMILLSLTQFALLRTRWTWLHLNISPNISMNWIKYSLLFFAMLSLLVFFLPTEYSLGLLETMQGLASIFTQLIALLLLLISLPFTFCLSLFSLVTGEPASSSPPAMIPPMVDPGDPSSEPLAWLVFLRSLLFWVIFVAVIVFALSYYLRQNSALWNSVRAFPVMQWLAGGWQAFRRWFKEVNQQVGELVKSTAQRIRTRRAAISMPNLRDLFDSRRLSPRDKVIFFFVSLTKMGNERGLGRQPYQTPHQYENQLSQAVPEVEPDLHDLTEAFYEARYSQHPFDEPKAEQAGSLWDHIKAILRGWQNK